MNWGSLSTDPNNHYIFVNDMRLGLWVQLIKQDPQSAVANTGGEAVNAGMGAVPMKNTVLGQQKPFHVAAGDPMSETAVWYAVRD